MTYIEHQHQQQQSSIMAIIRSSMNISPNEFYDSAIELLADDYSPSTSYCEPYLSTSLSTKKHPYNHHHHHHQSNNCAIVTSSSAINRLTNLVYTNSNSQSSNNTLVFNRLNQTKFNDNDSKTNPQPVSFDQQQQIDSSVSTLKSFPKSSTLSMEIISSRQKSSQSVISNNNRTLTMMNTKPKSTIVVNLTDNGNYSQSSLSTAINTSYVDNNRENRIYSVSQYQHRQPQQQINTNIKKQITIQQQPPSSISSSTTSGSPLRSSRSFTASYCSRPNVTLIRRKSASERLAESKGKYIGRMQSDANINCFNNRSDHDYREQQSIDSIRSMDTCTTSTNFIQSNQTTNSKSNSSIAEIHFIDGSNNLDNGSLISKINSHLNKIKKQSNQNNLVKKRISPKLSENSTGAVSNLEMQLRELISLDNVVNDVVVLPNRISNDFISKNDDLQRICESDDLIKQQKDIYRAELKYIGSSSSSSQSSSSPTQSITTNTTSSSSSSSSCSIFSEPYNISSSPEKMKRINDKLLFLSSSSSLKMEKKFSNISSQLPSICTDCKHDENLNLSTSVMRSKSDISPLSNNQRFSNNHSNPQEQDIDRIFKSLCLNSNHKPNENNNDNRMKAKQNERNIIFSSNDDSLKRKMHHHTNKDNYNVKNHHNNSMIYPGYEDSNSNKSTTISNEFSSFNSSSQLSVDEPSFNHTHNSKRRRIFHHHGGSTSKLTFENLMLHQQNLASSRSCTNLLANFHNGPSVVERNARIIKWLFNCRKAMDHQSTII